MSGGTISTILITVVIGGLILADIGRFSARKSNNQRALALAGEKGLTVDYSASFMNAQVIIDRTNQKLLFFFNEQSWVILPTKDIPKIRSYNREVTNRVSHFVIEIQTNHFDWPLIELSTPDGRFGNNVYQKIRVAIG